jgi:hypothetical protein
MFSSGFMVWLINRNSMRAASYWNFDKYDLPSETLHFIFMFETEAKTCRKR